jgi:hypothetical protein
MIDFMQNLQTEEHSFQEAFENARHPVTRSGPGNIPSSKDISGVEVRLSNVKIIDNKTPKVFPFPGFAKVYFVNLCVTDLSADAINVDLNGFEKVNDGDKLSLDRTLFAWKKTDKNVISPSQIHVFSSLIKSKQPLRDVAKILAEVKNDTGFKDTVTALNGVLKTASNVSNISNLIFQVAGIVGGFLGKVDDKPLLTWVQSFTDLNGDFDVLGKTDKNATNKFASMDLSITIRDKERRGRGK